MKVKSVSDYYKGVPRSRAARINKIRKLFLSEVDGLDETMKYKMPTFEKGDNWVALANQKNYISVYFCSEELIENIKNSHPEISTGKGCVRIRDSQEIPLEELKKSFIKAMDLKK